MKKNAKKEHFTKRDQERINISSERWNRNYEKFTLFRGTNHPEFNKYSELATLVGFKRIEYYQGSPSGTLKKFLRIAVLGLSVSSKSGNATNAALLGLEKSFFVLLFCVFCDSSSKSGNAANVALLGRRINF